MQFNRRQVLSTVGAMASLSSLSLASIKGVSEPSRALQQEFLAAVRAGDNERVRSMLASDGGLAETRDEAGRSAFCLAHLRGHTEVAKLLEETGLKLDLIESVLAEDWSRFQELAEENPRLLNQAHPIGGTPMYAAALVGSHAFWRLRGTGCKTDLAPAGGTGLTPMRGAIESAQVPWARISLCDLGGNGSHINTPQRGGSSVLHACVARKSEMLVRVAIRKGAKPDALDEQGRTPLALALQIGWEKGVQLLQGQASLPRDNRSSRFAFDANGEPIQRPDLADVPRELQSRVTLNSHGRLAKVQELVSKDKRLVFSISSDDELAIEASAHTGNRPLMRYHLDQGAPLSLPTAVSLGNVAMTRFLLERDPSLANERGAHDFPVLWYALLGGGSVEMAEELVSHGVSVDQESMGTTTLHWSVRRGDFGLAEFLLKSGCDPEAIGYKWSREGETPLQVAQKEGDSKMSALLKGEGARR